MIVMYRILCSYKIISLNVYKNKKMKLLVYLLLCSLQISYWKPVGSIFEKKCLLTVPLCKLLMNVDFEPVYLAFIIERFT